MAKRREGERENETRVTDEGTNGAQGTQREEGEEREINKEEARETKDN